MKSEEEFLAGIYQKAELIKKSAAEEETKEKNKVLRFRLSMRQGVAAAACFCLLLGLVVSGSRLTGQKDNAEEVNYDNQVQQIAAYMAGEDSPGKLRMAEDKLPVTGTVLTVQKDGDSWLAVLENQEDGSTVTFRVLYEAELQAGEKIALMLTVSEEGYSLTDAAELYRAAADGSYYNTDGTVFDEIAGGN